MSGRRAGGVVPAGKARQRPTRRPPARSATAAVASAGAAVMVLVTGCGSPDLLDPTEDPLATESEVLADRMTAGLAAAAHQLGAGEALGTRVDTWCSAGESNWKYTDKHRSSCQVTVSSGFALDRTAAEAFGGIEGLVAFEERMESEGWGGGGWQLARNAPGTLVAVEHLQEYDLPVTEVTGVHLYSAQGDGTSLRIGFVPATSPVDPAYPGPPGGYYGDTRGSDWQDAWAQQRDEHVLVITGWGDAVLAEQPW